MADVTIRDFLADLLQGVQAANAEAADESARQFARTFETTTEGRSVPRTAVFDVGGSVAELPLPTLLEARPAGITKLRARLETHVDLRDVEQPTELPPGDVLGLNAVERRDERSLTLGMTLRTGPSAHSTRVNLEVDVETGREPEAVALVRDQLNRQFRADLQTQTVRQLPLTPAEPAGENDG